MEDTERRDLCTDLNAQKNARETGLEPATSAVTGRCSNQLNYSRIEQMDFTIF